jgi:gliding motility-associated-like protein
MFKIRYLLLSLFAILVSSTSVLASHNRAGEIIYRRIDDNPFRFEITVITYTKTGGQSDDADRCELENFYFGDSSTPETIKRSNGPSSSNCDHIGEMIAPNTKKNIYVTTHTYPGVGTYLVHMEDQNRNAGVKNIPSSDNVWFYIESQIVIDPSTGGNTAPTLQNAPIDNGCVGYPFLHNPGAVDPDGDSLYYSLVDCKTMGGETIPGYQSPNELSSTASSLSIDPRSGTLTWDSPRESGEYNVAIRIEEWRYNNNSGDVTFVGSILRDMQIDIKDCPLRTPPVINDLRKTCIEAGQTLNVVAIANDQDGNELEFSANGFPIRPDGTAYLLADDTVVGFPPLELNFVWNTECRHVQFEPYWIYFKAKENIPNSEEELVDFEELEIQVVAPRVQITSVEPIGASLLLKWTAATCDGADGYDIYRYTDSTGYFGTNCNTGVPEALGYEKIGRNNDVTNTSFQDDDNGNGLIHGQRYCYMIVVTYPDRSESYASIEACGELIRDVPILNKASVNSTSETNGADSIAWYKPTELRTDVFLPPYSYRLSGSTSINGNYVTIFESIQSADYLSLDTVYVDTELNTEFTQYFYQIEMLSGPEKQSVGISRRASSIFLTSIPSDNKLRLEWNSDVPWINNLYTVYKFSTNVDSAETFYKVGSTTNTYFVDDGLVNLKEYRYFVRSTGRYSSETLPDTLLNNSQIHTGIPQDLQAPCTPPNKLITGDCNLDETTIQWNNPNNACDSVDDVLSYNIYFSPQLGKSMELIQINESPTDTTFMRTSNESIAGCYAITAIDSFGNESEMGEAVCIDNCPTYVLPNVFTPGTDGVNDFFQPFPYKYVESIDLQIFNRWGKIVHMSQDPDILWDGTDQSSGRPVVDGTYFYVCLVNEIRLVGIEQRELTGSFTMIRESSTKETPK